MSSIHPNPNQIPLPAPLQLEFSHLVVEEECAPPLNSTSSDFHVPPQPDPEPEPGPDGAPFGLLAHDVSFNPPFDPYQLLNSSSSSLDLSPSTTPSPLSSEHHYFPFLNNTTSGSDHTSLAFIVPPLTATVNNLSSSYLSLIDHYSQPSSSNHIVKPPSSPGPPPKPTASNNNNSLSSSEIETKIPKLIHLPNHHHQPKLSLLLLGLPDQGAKTRVETQIKLTLVLILGHQAQRASDGSLLLLDPNANDPISRVSNWSHVKLPFYSAIKRRSKKLLKTGIPPEETLFLDFSVTRATEPNIEIFCCPNCQIREQKRTQRKRDARVRPAQEIPSDVEVQEGPEDEAKKIVVFNCGQYLEFGTGQLTLPTRITCYCRHHREKKGFCVKITLRDHLNQLVAESITPPIMITDDHKAVAAAAKAKPGSDREILQTPTFTSRPIRKLPQAIKTSKSPGCSKRLKKKVDEPLDFLNSDWLNSSFELGLQEPSRPSTAQQFKRKAPPNEIVNQRNQNFRRTTPATSISFTAPMSPILTEHDDLTKLINQSFGIPTSPEFADERVKIGNMTDTISFAFPPPPPPAHHHRRKSLGVPSFLNNSGASRVARRSVVGHHQDDFPLAIEIPSAFGEHIDQSLATQHRYVNESVDQDALAAALDYLMPQPSHTQTHHHPHLRPGTHLDLSFCSFNNHNNNSSCTDLSSSSSPDRDRMFFGSSRTNTPTPIENSPETSAGSAGGFCRSGRDSPLIFGSCFSSTPQIGESHYHHHQQHQSYGQDPDTVMSLGLESAFETDLGSGNVELESNGTGRAGSPFGMLGNVFTNWNVLSSFLPAGTSPPPPPPPQPTESIPVLQPSQSDIPSSSNSHLDQQNNIHPTLSNQSVIPTTSDSSLLQSSSSSRIQKIVPNEGPVHGGIEITVLGSNFNSDIKVSFGDSGPIETQFWSSNTLVCILPPAIVPGPCQVKVVDQEEDDGENDVIFTYLKNTDGKLLELALQVVGFKITGNDVLDVEGFARKLIVESDKILSPMILQLLGYGDNTKTKNLDVVGNSGLESLVLSVLGLFVDDDDLVMNQDDKKDWVARNESSQNLLHLAVWLGMAKVCKFLLLGSKGDLSKKLVEGRDSNGCTALHFACLRKVECNVIEMLLRAGSRTYVRASGLNDRTALEIVKEWKGLEEDRVCVMELFGEKFRERQILLDHLKKREEISSGEEDEEEDEGWKNLEISFWEEDQKKCFKVPKQEKEEVTWKICSNPITELDIEPILELGWSNNSIPMICDDDHIVEELGWKKLIKKLDYVKLKNLKETNRISILRDEVKDDSEKKKIISLGNYRYQYGRGFLELVGGDQKKSFDAKDDEHEKNRSWKNSRMLWFVWAPMMVIGLWIGIGSLIMTKSFNLIGFSSVSSVHPKSICEAFFGGKQQVVGNGNWMVGRCA